jgi:hypothetical protein
MGKRVGPPRARRFDRSPDFLFGILSHIDRVGRRGDATASHNLDLLRSAFEFLACRPADGVHAVSMWLKADVRIEHAQS